MWLCAVVCVIVGCVGVACLGVLAVLTVINPQGSYYAMPPIDGKQK
ncbi:hypothetical protein LCGC14_1275280 [marine sediment metagenome]|uniref:Uncharacterized protein n=1 Tax=marine sediment metagenome TaxID=412755 RepID=A0A0F9P010_9ZZZZ